MRCSQCHTELEPGEVFCGECGRPVSLTPAAPTKDVRSVTCPSCGYAVERGEQFCGECGRSMGPPFERPPQPRVQPIAYAAPQRQARAGSGCGLIAVLLIIGLIILGGIGVGAWLWFRDSSLIQSNNQNTGNRGTGTNQNTRAIPVPTPDRPNSNQIENRSHPGWTAWNYRGSIRGENLTYYEGSTLEQCQADCDKNEQCRGFTFIRAGADSPTDPPMCYLFAVVTEIVTHDGCISAVKR